MKGGSVPDLLVENRGDVRVLFLEGEELIGAKQNRILNTSVLVAAHTKVKIPVSCVERGRWGLQVSVLWIEWLSFPIETTPCTQGVGEPVSQRESRIQIGPRSGLERSRLPPCGARHRF